MTSHNIAINCPLVVHLLSGKCQSGLVVTVLHSACVVHRAWLVLRRVTICIQFAPLRSIIYIHIVSTQLLYMWIK